MSLANDLVANTEVTLAALPESEWESVVRFFLPSLLNNRPNDLMRILLNRAMRRSPDGDPTRQLQLIMQALDLQIGTRL